MSTLFVIIAWALTILTLFGNGFVILLILSKKCLRSSKVNWFIVSLAAADVLVGLSLFPPLFFCESWLSCQTSFMRAFRWIFIYSSVCNLCAMTADRYLAITTPIWYRCKISGRIVAIWIALSWLFPVVLRGVVFTPVYFVYKREALRYFLPILVVLFEALPCLIILFAALRISVIAKRQQSKHRNRSKGQTNEKNRHSGSSALRMTLFIAVLFLFCYALEVYYTMCKIVLKLCEDAEILQMIRRLLLITNSAINPFVYALFKRDIQDEVKKLKQCCKR